MNKQEKIKKLFFDLEKDNNLPLDGDIVFSQGSANSKIVFIGEAPGVNELKLRKPFVGLSGKLLDKSLLEIGINRESVYISNIVKRRPPENRDPNENELKAYGFYLEKELEIIKPVLVVTLGRFALNYFLKDEKISSIQGKIVKLKNFHLLAIFHPAATFRRKEVLEQFKKSFLVLQDFINDNNIKIK